MKTERIYLGLLLLFVALFAGCSEETLGPNTGSGGGDEQEVRLQIRVFDEKSPKTNNATRKMQGNEGVINGKVRIYVYNDKDNLEYKNEDVALDNKETTIKLKTGHKYLYVIANPIDGKTIEAKNSRVDFERQIMDITFPDGETPDITGSSFLMGTLWPQVITVIRPVDENDNIFPISIGRLAAKATLWRVNGDNKEYSNMKGTFVEPYYSIGSVPTKTFLIGQLKDSGSGSVILPPEPNHSVVESAVHNEPAVTKEDDKVQNPVFFNYTSEFKKVDPTRDPDALINFFYLVENTTALNALDDDNQYFGNTTYIRLKTKYIPDQSEIYSKNFTQKGTETLTDGTFYTCMHENRLYIINEVPDGTVNYTEYKNGINYHFFPIMNETQSDDLTIYSVLRNHYYEIEVTGIKDLGAGSNKNKEDPWIPIPKKFDVLVQVNVVDWSKITQETPI